jgi:hypothetical protein
MGSPVPWRRNLPSTSAARPHVGQHTTPFIAGRKGVASAKDIPRSPNQFHGLSGHTAPRKRAATQPYPRAAQHRTEIGIRTSGENILSTPHARNLLSTFVAFENLTAAATATPSLGPLKEGRA